MRSYILVVLMFLMALTGSAQKLAVKSNILYDATLTPNIGVEYKFTEKFTGQITAGYNAWGFSDNKKWKHILVQPELKYWLCSTYAGHFFGTHLIYTHYNASNVKLPFGMWSGLQDHRYQGDLGAIGVSYGYSWMIGKRWSIEGSVGLGYGFTSYKKYDCVKCGTYHGKETKHLFMPTKLALSIVYYLN